MQPKKCSDLMEHFNIINQKFNETKEFTDKDLFIFQRKCEESKCVLISLDYKHAKLWFQDLAHIFAHLLFKIQYKKDKATLLMVTTCAKVLSCFIRVTLVLNYHKSREEVYIIDVFTKIKYFPGDKSYVLKALLLIRSLNKKFQGFYGRILKELFFRTEFSVIVKNASDYFLLQLLLRRLYNLAEDCTTKVEANSLSKRLEQPSDVNSFLDLCGIRELRAVDFRGFCVQSLTRKNVSKLRKVLLPDTEFVCSLDPVSMSIQSESLGTNVNIDNVPGKHEEQHFKNPEEESKARSLSLPLERIESTFCTRLSNPAPEKCISTSKPFLELTQKTNNISTNTDFCAHSMVAEGIKTVCVEFKTADNFPSNADKENILPADSRTKSCTQNEDLSPSVGLEKQKSVSKFGKHIEIDNVAEIVSADVASCEKICFDISFTNSIQLEESPNKVTNVYCLSASNVTSRNKSNVTSESNLALPRVTRRSSRLSTESVGDTFMKPNVLETLAESQSSQTQINKPMATRRNSRSSTESFNRKKKPNALEPIQESPSFQTSTEIKQQPDIQNSYGGSSNTIGTNTDENVERLESYMACLRRQKRADAAECNVLTQKKSRRNRNTSCGSVNTPTPKKQKRDHRSIRCSDRLEERKMNVDSHSEGSMTKNISKHDTHYSDESEKRPVSAVEGSSDTESYTLKTKKLKHTIVYNSDDSALDEPVLLHFRCVGDSSDAGTGTSSANCSPQNETGAAKHVVRSSSKNIGHKSVEDGSSVDFEADSEEPPTKHSTRTATILKVNLPEKNKPQKCVPSRRITRSASQNST